MPTTEAGPPSENSDHAARRLSRRHLLTLLAAPAALWAVGQPMRSIAAVGARVAHGGTAKAATSHDRFGVAGTTDAEVRPFLAGLQAAVAADDRRTVTRMFFFPSKVWDGGHSFAVLRRRDLIDHYDQVFDAGLKQAIAQARIETLFANWQGVSLGDGRLWFARITTQSRLAVTAINAPVRANG